MCWVLLDTYNFCNGSFTSLMNNFDMVIQLYLLTKPCPHSSHSVFSSVISKALIWFSINVLSSTWYVQFLQWKLYLTNEQFWYVYSVLSFDLTLSTFVTFSLQLVKKQRVGFHPLLLSCSSSIRLDLSFFVILNIKDCCLLIKLPNDLDYG